MFGPTITVLSKVKSSHIYLAPARLVPSSCASAPRNTREVGISSYTYMDEKSNFLEVAGQILSDFAQICT